MTRLGRTLRLVAGIAAALAVAAAVAGASTDPNGPPDPSTVNRIETLVTSPELDGQYGGDVIQGDRVDVYGTAAGIPAMLRASPSASAARSAPAGVAAGRATTASAASRPAGPRTRAAA